MGNIAVCVSRTLPNGYHRPRPWTTNGEKKKKTTSSKRTNQKRRKCVNMKWARGSFDEIVAGAVFGLWTNNTVYNYNVCAQCNFFVFVVASYLKIYGIFGVWCVGFVLCFLVNFFAANEVKTKLPKIILNLYGVQFGFFFRFLLSLGVTEQRRMCRASHFSPQFFLCFFWLLLFFVLVFVWMFLLNTVS